MIYFNLSLTTIEHRYVFQSVPRRLELSVDLFEEMATIARPPLVASDGGGSGSAAGSKRPLTDETGYIVCLYKVFRGDDGEKFERNWLFWTGEWYNMLPIPNRDMIASSGSGIS